MDSNYNIIRQIGKGAYGIAYIAENTSDQSRFVLKKVRLARQSLKERKASLQELHILSHLSHRNVLHYLDSWIEAGCVVCLAVELCESGDLLSQLQYRSRKDDLVYFSETHLREMLVQLASALDYLHRNNIVHRDVKSSNILITDAGRLKLADFGLATTLKSEEDFMCKTQVGTPNYMSPELMQDKSYSAKADIFALGCVMYELCALKPAFKAFDMKGLQKKIISGPTPLIPSHYSEELRNMVKSLMAKDESKRPAAAEIMANPAFESAMERVTERFGLPVGEGKSVEVVVGAPPPSIAKLTAEFEQHEVDEEKRRKDDVEKRKELRAKYSAKHMKLKLEREKEKEEAAAVARAKAKLVGEPLLARRGLSQASSSEAQASGWSGSSKPSQRPPTRSSAGSVKVRASCSGSPPSAASRLIATKVKMRRSDSNIPVSGSRGRRLSYTRSEDSRSSLDLDTTVGGVPRANGKFALHPQPPPLSRGKCSMPRSSSNPTEMPVSKPPSCPSVSRPPSHPSEMPVPKLSACPSVSRPPSHPSEMPAPKPSPCPSVPRPPSRSLQTSASAAVGRDRDRVRTSASQRSSLEERTEKRPSDSGTSVHAQSGQRSMLARSSYDGERGSRVGSSPRYVRNVVSSSGKPPSEAGRPHVAVAALANSGLPKPPSPPQPKAGQPAAASGGTQSAGLAASLRRLSGVVDSVSQKAVLPKLHL